jgi:hypothetical protein
MSQINGAHVSSEEMLFEPELVVRSSTAPVRSSQAKAVAAAG